MSQKTPNPFSYLVLYGKISKDMIANVALEISDSIEEGILNPLDIYLKVKILEATVEALKKQLQDKATDEALKYGKEEHNMHGLKIRIGETGARYKYDHIPAWREVQEQIQAAQQPFEERRKMLEDLAKAAIDPMKICVDPETGEQIQAAIKESKTSLIVTIPKN